MKRFAIRFNAPVVLSFAIISLLVLVLDSVTGGASTARLFCVYRAPLTDPLTYVRFFTHVLGHSGYSHYMGNMLLLLLVGPGLEEKYGSRNLLATIAVTAFATGLVQFLLFPHSALLGASGVVFMMIVLSSFTEMKKGGIPLTMLQEEAVEERRRDYKTELQELVQRRSNQTLHYEMIGATGPDHAKLFTCAVLLNGQTAGTGTGKSKKEAEQAAARAALQALQ